MATENENRETEPGIVSYNGCDRNRMVCGYKLKVEPVSRMGWTSKVDVLRSSKKDEVMHEENQVVIGEELRALWASAEKKKGNETLGSGRNLLDDSHINHILRTQPIIPLPTTIHTPHTPPAGAFNDVFKH